MLSRMTVGIFLLCLPPALIADYLGVTPVAGDDPIYTVDASGTVAGDFEWSVSEPSFITTTTSFSTFLSMTSSEGCTISGATINNPLSADPFIETFFSPDCLGFSEVAQTFWSAGPLTARV